LLHRILQRNCIGFCSALKIGISYLQVMFAGFSDTVAEPGADNMQREASLNPRDGNTTWLAVQAATLSAAERNPAKAAARLLRNSRAAYSSATLQRRLPAD
jgi:hypothetical protein